MLFWWQIQDDRSYAIKTKLQNYNANQKFDLILYQYLLLEKFFLKHKIFTCNYKFCRPVQNMEWIRYLKKPGISKVLDKN